MTRWLLLFKFIYVYHETLLTVVVVVVIVKSINSNTVNGHETSHTDESRVGVGRRRKQMPSWNRDLGCGEGGCLQISGIFVLRK